MKSKKRKSATSQRARDLAVKRKSSKITGGGLRRTVSLPGEPIPPPPPSGPVPVPYPNLVK
jgi:hypothetical protein